MEFHGIEMIGSFINQLLSTKPTYTSNDEGRLIFVQNESALYCGSTGSIGKWMLMIDGASDQTIGGTKTFTTIPYLPSTDPTHDNHAVRKGYLDDIISSSLTYKVKVTSNDTTADYLYSKLRAGDGITISEYNDGGNEDVQISITNIDTYVKTTGNQSIAGIKTFTSFPVLPSSEPSTDYQAANKKYVDDQIAGVGGMSDTYKVKVKSSDTTANYLYNKVVAGSNYIDIGTSGSGDIDLTIDLASTYKSAFHKVKVSSNDTTPGYLINKLLGTDLVSISEYNDGNNEKVKIEVNLNNMAFFGFPPERKQPNTTYDAETPGFLYINNFTADYWHIRINGERIDHIYPFSPYAGDSLTYLIPIPGNVTYYVDISFDPSQVWIYWVPILFS